jgi:hypothetical protein
MLNRHRGSVNLCYPLWRAWHTLDVVTVNRFGESVTFWPHQAPYTQEKDPGGEKQMITCQRATERLVAHWNAPTPQVTEETQAAIDHVHHCPRCAGRLCVLIRALSQDVEDPLTCAMCQALLPGYVQTEQDGEGREARWQPVAAHLASCPYCMLARAELEALLDLAYAKIGQQAEATPAPDLAFLHSSQNEASAPWQLDELGRLTIELTEQLLSTLLPPAHDEPARRSEAASAYTAAGKSAVQATLFELPIQAPDADLDVTIQAESERAVPDRCTLSVQVDLPSRGGWPHLAGTTVTLKQNGREPAQEWTDSSGRAVFENVPIENLAGLVIEVRPGD